MNLPAPRAFIPSPTLHLIYVTFTGVLKIPVFFGKAFYRIFYVSYRVRSAVQCGIKEQSKILKTTLVS